MTNAGCCARLGTVVSNYLCEFGAHFGCLISGGQLQAVLEILEVNGRVSGRAKYLHENTFLSKTTSNGKNLKRKSSHVRRSKCPCVSRCSSVFSHVSRPTLSSPQSIISSALSPSMHLSWMLSDLSLRSTNMPFRCKFSTKVFGVIIQNCLRLWVLGSPRSGTVVSRPSSSLSRSPCFSTRHPRDAGCILHVNVFPDLLHDLELCNLACDGHLSMYHESHGVRTTPRYYAKPLPMFCARTVLDDGACFGTILSQRGCVGEITHDERCTTVTRQGLWMCVDTTLAWTHVVVSQTGRSNKDTHRELTVTTLKKTNLRAFSSENSTRLLNH